MVIYQVIDNVKTSLIFPTSPTLLYAESHFLKTQNSSVPPTGPLQP